MPKPADSDTRRAWVDVDLDALAANAGKYQRAVGVPILPMIKADGYGLGAVEAAGALIRANVWGFGVATLDEALALRGAGVMAPIVVFSPLMADEVARHLAADVRPVIGDRTALTAWVAAGAAPFHVEIDSGMRRTGFDWRDAATLRDVGTVLQRAAGFEGIFTHFHSSGSDAEATATQWQRLQDAITLIGCRPRLVHAANSAAAAYGTRYGGDLARPGIALYGGAVAGLDTAPVAALRARVVALRRVAPGDTVSYDATWTATTATTIATLAIGYADGLPRHLSNVGVVELAGARRPIVGRVTMDYVMVDVGGADVAIGDIATIFGGTVSLDEQAGLAGTIGYALLTALGTRLPRRYHRSL